MRKFSALFMISVMMLSIVPSVFADTFAETHSELANTLLGERSAGDTITVGGKTYTIKSVTSNPDGNYNINVQEGSNPSTTLIAKGKGTANSITIQPPGGTTSVVQASQVGTGPPPRSLIPTSTTTRTTTPLATYSEGSILTHQDGTTWEVKGGKLVQFEYEDGVKKTVPGDRSIQDSEFISSSAPIPTDTAGINKIFGGGTQFQAISNGKPVTIKPVFTVDSEGKKVLATIEGKMLFGVFDADGMRIAQVKQSELNQYTLGKEAIGGAGPLQTDPRDRTTSPGGVLPISNPVSRDNLVGGGVSQNDLSNAFDLLLAKKSDRAAFTKLEDKIEAENEARANEIDGIKEHINSGLVPPGQIPALLAKQEVLRNEIRESFDNEFDALYKRVNEADTHIAAAFNVDLTDEEKENPYFSLAEDPPGSGYLTLVPKNPQLIKEIQERLDRSNAVPGNVGLFFDPETGKYFTINSETAGFTEDVTHIEGNKFKVDITNVGLAFDSDQGCHASSSTGRCFSVGDEIIVGDRPYSLLTNVNGEQVLYSEGGFFSSTSIIVQLPDGTRESRPYDDEAEQILERQIAFEDAVKAALAKVKFDDAGNPIKDPSLTFDGEAIDISKILAQAQAGFQQEVGGALNARKNYLPPELTNEFLEDKGYSKADIAALRSGDETVLQKLKDDDVISEYGLEKINRIRNERDLDALVYDGVISETQKRELELYADDDGKLPKDAKYGQMKDADGILLYNEDGSPKNGVINDDGTEYELSPEKKAEKAAKDAQRRQDAADITATRETPVLGLLLNGIGYMRSLIAAGNKFKGIGAVASLFIEDDDMYGIKDEVHEAFCDSVIFADESCRAQAFCEISPDHIKGGSAVLIGGAPESFRASAHIEAYVYPPYIETVQSPSGRESFRLERLYQVTYSVALAEDEQDSFNVLFKGPLGDNRMFTSDQSLSKGGSEARGRSNPYIKYSRNLYEEVCLIFRSGIADYTGEKHKRLCTPIVEKTGRAPDPVQKKADEQTTQRGENPNF